MQDISRVELFEKEDLWGQDEQPTKGLDIRLLMYAYLLLAAVLLVCIPKIYLSSSIYYLSREITKLQTQSDLLKEENRRLNNQHETLRYKYLKLNTEPQLH